MADDQDAKAPAGASEARVAASRRNGSKGRGPVTDAGKAASSRNALRHGLTATRWAVLPGEAAGDLELLRFQWLDWLRPQGPIEAQLVEQAVLAAWRLGRGVRVESEVWQVLCRPEDDDAVPLDLGSGLVRDAGCGHPLDKVQRHRSAAERSLARALQLLARLRGGRDALVSSLRGTAPITVEERHYKRVDRDLEPSGDGLVATMVALDTGPGAASVTFPLDQAAARLHRLRRHGSILLDGEAVGPVTRDLAGCVTEANVVAHVAPEDRAGIERAARCLDEAAEHEDAAAEIAAEERHRACDAERSARRAADDAYFASLATSPWSEKNLPPIGMHPPADVAAPVLQNEPEAPTPSPPVSLPAPPVRGAEPRAARHDHLKPAREKVRHDPWKTPQEFLGKAARPPPSKAGWQW